MPERKFIVNSAVSKEEFKKKIDALYGSGNYLVFSWKSGKQSTMGQKALFHIWLKKYAAHLLKKPEGDVTTTDMEAMKRSVKVHYYNETHESFMVEMITDPFHPDKRRPEPTSSSKWNPTETYHVMTWLQERAMHDGLILESIGVHKNMTQEMTQ